MSSRSDETAAGIVSDPFPQVVGSTRPRVRAFYFLVTACDRVQHVSALRQIELTETRGDCSRSRSAAGLVRDV